MPDYTPLARSRSARFGLTPRALQAPEERDEVGLLLFAEPERKAPVVEIHDVAQRGGRTVVEVRRPTGEPTQDRSFEASDVLPATGDHRPPRVGDDLDLARRPVAERVDRHVPDGQPEPVVDAVAALPDRHRWLGDANVQGRRHGVVAGVRRVVTRRAGADNRDVEATGSAEVVVDAGDGDDRDRECVEEILTADDRGAEVRRFWAFFGGVCLDRNQMLRYPNMAMFLSAEEIPTKPAAPCLKRGHS